MPEEINTPDTNAEIKHYSQLQPAAGVVADDVAGTEFDPADDTVAVSNAVGGSGPRTDKAHTNFEKVERDNKQEERRAKKRSQSPSVGSSSTSGSSSKGSGKKSS